MYLTYFEFCDIIFLMKQKDTYIKGGLLMNITVTAISAEKNTLTRDDINKIKTFSGKNAGICYMKEKYFDSYITDNEKALNRFATVAATGHHSIADHARITILFENISKIIAMVLNSLGDYSTSEKSGRYTVMKAGGEEEKLYNKWLEIFKTRIKEVDCTTPDTLVTKLAQENARYTLSVFLPATTMSYTTSIRQYNYIIDWCERYVAEAPERNTYEKMLKQEIKELRDSLINAGLYVDELRDNKNRKFNFLANQVKYNIDSAKESYSDSYLIKYSCSFAMLAQAQRHRTLDYFMSFDGEARDFYIPEVIKDTDYEEEWINDLTAIKDTTPIATMVNVVETGLFTNFLLKCDERLCGRAQLEIMKNTINTLHKFDKTNELSSFAREEMRPYCSEGHVFMKCARVKCKEPCHWGAQKAQTKKF